MRHEAPPSPASATAQDAWQPVKTLGRALPYLISWGVLAVLMVVGMTRVPMALYTPIDGDWAKWNAEAITPRAYRNATSRFSLNTTPTLDAAL